GPVKDSCECLLLLRKRPQPPVCEQSLRPSFVVITDQTAEHSREVNRDMIELYRTVIHQPGQPVALEQQMVVPDVTQAPPPRTHPLPALQPASYLRGPALNEVPRSP